MSKRNKLNNKLTLGTIFIFLIIAITIITTIIPFALMILGGFKENYEIITLTPKLWPQEGLNFRKYVALFEYWPFARNMVNSVYVTVVKTLGTCFFCSIMGYAFAKYNFPGKEGLYIIVLSSIMIPLAARLIPTYLVVKAMGGINTYWALIIPGIVPPFGVFMVRQYAKDGIPDELLEAARIEGANEWEILFKIALPILRPCIISLAVLTFMQVWNDFLWPLVAVLNKEMFTVTVALRSLSDTTLSQDTGIILAAATLSALPILIFYLVAHKKMMQGMLEGAIK